MRVLFSGVIGAVASASVWLWAEHLQQAKVGWMVCLIGLVTGVVMHKASQLGATKPGTGRGFARGALAVVLTLAAILGGQRAYATYLQSTSSSASKVSTESLQVADASEPGSEATKGNAAPAVLPDLSSEARDMGPGDYSQSAIKQNLSDWDMIWMGLAALAAYVTGKGGDGVSRVAATEELRVEATDVHQETAETRRRLIPDNRRPIRRPIRRSPQSRLARTWLAC